MRSEQVPGQREPWLSNQLAAALASARGGTAVSSWPGGRRAELGQELVFRQIEQYFLNFLSHMFTQDGRMSVHGGGGSGRQQK